MLRLAATSSFIELTVPLTFLGSSDKLTLLLRLFRLENLLCFCVLVFGFCTTVCSGFPKDIRDIEELCTLRISSSCAYSASLIFIADFCTSLSARDRFLGVFSVLCSERRSANVSDGLEPMILPAYYSDNFLNGTHSTSSSLDSEFDD